MEEVRISKNSFDVQGFVFFSALIIATALAAAWLNFGVHFALGNFIEEQTFAEAGLTSEKRVLAQVQADAEGPVVSLSTLVERPGRYRTIGATVYGSQEHGDGTEITEQSKPSLRNVGQFEVAIPQEGSFVYADLSDMKLYLFEKGQIMRVLKILSKGKKGSRWETPTGFYSIKTKEKNHLSSIGDVYMPYSMQFYGNFFIHGWPYYKDGTEVPFGFSGGCIRLSTDDAKKIYDFVKIDTPVFVHETVVKASATIDADDSATSTPQARMPLKRVPLPEVSAKAFLVADLDTGDVYAEMNPQEKRPIASVSKLVTALVVNEAISYNKKIPITKAAVATSGESGRLKAGESISATNLLFPLLMESSNDAAVAFAQYVGSKRFMQLMNQKVQSIGMVQTSFEDPAGLSEKNISTADDLFILSRYLYERQAYLLGITRQKSKTLASALVGARELRNFNIFSSDSSFIGGKTGKTMPAKETMVSLFREQAPAGVYNVAIIVLGSDNRRDDIVRLREWFYESAGGTLAQIR